MSYLDELNHKELVITFAAEKYLKLVKELFPEKALFKEFAQPTAQKRYHSGLL